MIDPLLSEKQIMLNQAVELLKTLANRDRLLLACRLIEGEANVGQLESELGIAQPTLSQQLGILRRAELVITRKEGKQVYYQLGSPQAIAVIETLYEHFCQKLKGEDHEH